MSPFALLGALAAGAAFGFASISALHRHVPRAAWVTIIGIALSLAIVVEATDAIGSGVGMTAVFGIVLGASVADYHRQRAQLVQERVDQALEELTERDASGTITNARALELMRPALESQMRRRGTVEPGRRLATHTTDEGQFEDLDPEAAAALGPLVYAPGETGRNVLATGLLWHSRRVGQWNGRLALRVEHVIDRHQLPALEAHVRRMPAATGTDGWQLLALTPHTSNSNGHIVLAVPSALTDHSVAAAELRGDLNDVRLSPAR